MWLTLQIPKNNNNRNQPSQKPKTKPKSKRQVKRQSPKPVKRTNTKPQDSIALSKCTYHLAKAIADPRSVTNVSASDGQMSDSRKVTITLSGAGSTGVNGFGWILPCLGIASDSCAALVTSSGYTGATQGNASPFSANNTLNTGVNIVQPIKCPQTSNVMSGVVDGYVATGRIVDAEITVRYNGTNLNEGGTVVCYADPDHNSVSGISVADITSKAPHLFNVENYNRKECTLKLSPISQQELNPGRIYSVGQSVGDIWNVYPFSGGDEQFTTQYNGTTAYTYAQGGVSIGVPTAAILVNSAVSAQPFWYEITYHVEYGGELNQPYATPNAIDVEGSRLVLTAAKRAALAMVPRNRRLHAILKWMKVLYDEVKPILIPLAQLAITAL